ncbi:hypothetical protein DFH07DRAFT_938836, partial [Mycena maculata]
MGGSGVLRRDRAVFPSRTSLPATVLSFSLFPLIPTFVTSVPFTPPPSLLPENRTDLRFPRRGLSALARSGQRASGLDGRRRRVFRGGGGRRRRRREIESPRVARLRPGVGVAARAVLGAVWASDRMLAHAVVVWRGRGSLEWMVPKDAREANLQKTRCAVGRKTDATDMETDVKIDRVYMKWSSTLVLVYRRTRRLRWLQFGAHRAQWSRRDRPPPGTRRCHVSRYHRCGRHKQHLTRICVRVRPRVALTFVPAGPGAGRAGGGRTNKSQRRDCAVSGRQGREGGEMSSLRRASPSPSAQEYPAPAGIILRVVVRVCPPGVHVACRPACWCGAIRVDEGAGAHAGGASGIALLGSSEFPSPRRPDRYPSPTTQTIRDYISAFFLPARPRPPLLPLVLIMRGIVAEEEEGGDDL